MYCFDTDIISAVLRRDPPLHLLRRLALVSPRQQFTTAVTLGELLYGVARRGSPTLPIRVRDPPIGGGAFQRPTHDRRRSVTPEEGTVKVSRLILAFLPMLLLVPTTSPACPLLTEPRNCIPNRDPVIWTPRGPVAPGKVVVALGGEITTAYAAIKPIKSLPGAVVVGPNLKRPVVMESGGSRTAATTASPEGQPCNNGLSCSNAEQRNDYAGSIENGQLSLTAVWTNIFPTIDTGDRRYDFWSEKASARGRGGNRVWALSNQVESRGVAQIVDWDPYTTTSTGEGQGITVGVKLGPASVSTSFPATAGKVSGGPPYDDRHGVAAGWWTTQCCGSGDVVGVRNVALFVQPSTSTTPWFVQTTVAIG